MKRILIVTVIILLSVRAYSQIQPEVNSHQRVAFNRCLLISGDQTQINPKHFLAERYLGKSLIKKFENHLKTGFGVKAALGCRNQTNGKFNICHNIDPVRKSKFYFKMVKGEWNHCVLSFGDFRLSK